jgi:hypothetical protein
MKKILTIITTNTTPLSGRGYTAIPASMPEWQGNRRSSGRGVVCRRRPAGGKKAFGKCIHALSETVATAPGGVHAAGLVALL